MVETLQEFRSRNPHLAGFFAYLDRLNSESPRGKVLISVGLIEEQLRRVLLALCVMAYRQKSLLMGQLPHWEASAPGSLPAIHWA
jgi:hypothetical protein